MEGFKDPQLEGIYVKRCKCGSRPYLDRIFGHGIYWLKCSNCDKTSESGNNINTAVDNWNNNKLTY